MLTEIPAQAQNAFGAYGIAAVANDTTVAIRHTRNRAGTAGTPPRISRIDNQPPTNPPAAANTGGTHAYHATSASVMRYAAIRYTVVHPVQREYPTMLKAL